MVDPALAFDARTETIVVKLSTLYRFAFALYFSTVYNLILNFLCLRAFFAICMQNMLYAFKETAIFKIV